MPERQADSLRQTDPNLVAARLRRLSQLRPSLGMVLGSGFQHAVSKLELDAEVAYERLPGFPSVHVSGHAGKLLIGRLAGTPVIVLSGRAHFYEGHSMADVTFAIRVLAAYGIRAVLLTNAAGAVNPRLRPGDFMVVIDHINFMGASPLRGAPAAGLPQFVDLSSVYDDHLRNLMHQAGKACCIKLKFGVYLAVSGPSYETPAEIRAFAGLGADAVGMSTVPEAVVARQCGLKVAALSCITNQAAGLGGGPLSHAEVLRSMQRVKGLAAQMLTKFAGLYAHGHA